MQRRNGLGRGALGRGGSRRRLIGPLLCVGAALFGVVVNCGGGGAAGHLDPICQPGALQSCTGALGCTGQARCASDGLRLGACSCDTTNALIDGGSMSAAGGAPQMGAGGTHAAAGTSHSGGTGGSAPVMDAGSDAAACVDECDLNTLTSCVNGSITTCFDNPLSGCSVSYQFNCAIGTCADENHCTGCVDECPTPGASGCNKGQLGSCSADQQGCLKWQATQDCAQGFCADDQTCGTCTQGCTTAGAVECLNGESRVCVQDEFGCRGWSEFSECPTLQCQSASQCWIGYAAGQRGTPKNDQGLALFLDSRGAAASAGLYHRYGATSYRDDGDAYLQVRDAQDTLIKDVVWGSDADDVALGVTVDRDFNHLVVGWTVGQIGANAHVGGRDAFVAKWADDPAEPTWIRQWGSTEHDIPRAVATDSASSVFAVGSTGGLLGDAQLGGDDLFVTKWDAAGNRLWTKQWGTDKADVITAATMDATDHLWVAGRTADKLGADAPKGDYDAFLAELDNDGTVLQVRQFGTTFADSAEGIAIDQDGNILVGGNTQGDLNGELSTGGVDAFVVKFDTNLDPLWTRLWGTDHDDWAHALALGSGGGPHLAVTVQTTADPACDPGQLAAVGWDTDGVSTVNQQWDSCGVEGAGGIAVKPDGQVLVLGWTEGDLVNESRGGSDILLIALQP